VVKVYAEMDEGDHKAMKLVHSFNKFKDDDGNVIRPYNLMTHATERQLILGDKLDPQQMFRVDLETGKVIEQFTAKDGVDIASITNSVKNGQESADSTFLGVS
jgi:hypothetical protein